jgi:hypothetical protein
MFGREIGVDARSSILKLYVRVRLLPHVAEGRKRVPLLGRKKEMVAGTVTRVVTVRMK